MTWPFVAVLMITEIVSNGMLSLPSSLDAVGMVPGVIVTIAVACGLNSCLWCVAACDCHDSVSLLGRLPTIGTSIVAIAIYCVTARRSYVVHLMPAELPLLRNE